MTTKHQNFGIIENDVLIVFSKVQTIKELASVLIIRAIQEENENLIYNFESKRILCDSYRETINEINEEQVAEPTFITDPKCIIDSLADNLMNRNMIIDVKLSQTITLTQRNVLLKTIILILENSFKTENL